MPTRRKPRVQFRIEGVGGGGSVAEEAMVVVGVWVRRVLLQVEGLVFPSATMSSTLGKDDEILYFVMEYCSSWKFMASYTLSIESLYASYCTQFHSGAALHVCLSSNNVQLNQHTRR